MKARIAVAISILAGVAVITRLTIVGGADLAGVLGLLPIRLHVLALAALLTDIAGRATRIALLARGVGHRVRFSTSLWSVLAGEAAGGVTPSRAGSAPAKVALLTRDRMDGGTGTAVVVGETLAEAIALIPLALVALVFFPAGRTGAWAALVYVILVVGAFAFLYWVARLPLRTAPRWWARVGLSDRRWRVLRVMARRFRHRAKTLGHLPPVLLAAIGLVTVIHITGRLAVLPALAVGRVHGSAVAALVGWPFLLLYAGAMVPTPAGGGAVEAAFAATLTTVLGAGDVAAMLLWWRVYTFYVPAILGGALFILGGVLLRRRRATPASGSDGGWTARTRLASPRHASSGGSGHNGHDGTIPRGT